MVSLQDKNVLLHLTNWSEHAKFWLLCDKAPKYTIYFAPTKHWAIGVCIALNLVLRILVEVQDGTIPVGIKFGQKRLNNHKLWNWVFIHYKLCIAPILYTVMGNSNWADIKHGLWPQRAPAVLQEKDVSWWVWALLFLVGKEGLFKAQK